MCCFVWVGFVIEWDLQVCFTNCIMCISHISAPKVMAIRTACVCHLQVIELLDSILGYDLTPVSELPRDGLI